MSKVRQWDVNIYETYADGTVYDVTVQFTASTANIAMRRALAWDGRSKELSGHGGVVNLFVKAVPCRC